MKNKLINIFLILALVAGLSLLLYPTVSDYWNSLHASQAVASYDQAVKSMDEGKYDELLQRAGQYNRDLFLRGTLFALTDEEREDYNSQLDIDGSGVMGYIEIPTIKVSLPIYHGTSDDVLQVAVGHLEWSSLPVGGESTHCVLSGHRGLPSAKLFTNLDQLAEGDLFVIRSTRCSPTRSTAFSLSCPASFRPWLRRRERTSARSSPARPTASIPTACSCAATASIISPRPCA